MKNIFLIVVILISFNSISAQAQDRLQMGLKAGINVSDYTGRWFEDRESFSRKSFHVGLVGELSLTSRWNLQPEFLYSEQGFGFRNEFQEELKINLNYLQLPVLVEYELVNGFFIQGGPQISYLLEEENRIVYLTHNYNKFDLSLGFGAEYKIKNFYVYGRYNTGINRIFNSSELQAHNRVIQGGVGLDF